MHQHSVNTTIHDLQYKFDDILNEKDIATFYLKIADYGRYILNDPFVEYIVNPLFEESVAIRKPYEKAFLEFTKEWKVKAELLVEDYEKLVKKGYKNAEVEEEIYTIKNRLEEIENLQFWDNSLPDFNVPYKHILHNLNATHKSIVDKHCSGNKYLIDESLSKASDEWDKYVTQRSISVWWSHYQITRIATGVFELEGYKHYFKEDSTVDTLYLYEFKCVQRGDSERTLIFLRKDKYNDFLKRIHNYLIPRLRDLANTVNFILPEHGKTMNGSDVSNSKPEIIEKAGFTLNITKSSLSYLGSRPILVSCETQPYKLFKMLLESDGVVNFKTIKKALDLQCGEAAYMCCNDVRKRLKSSLVNQHKIIGEKTFQEIFKTVKKVGYQLVEN